MWTTFEHFRTHCGSSPSDYAIRNHTLSSSINIQEDLDNYLSDFGVQLFFSDLVEKLLSSEASNPFMAIVEYLGEKFPEQTILALEINQPQRNKYVFRNIFSWFVCLFFVF